jgi:DNA modification methylase
VKGFSALAIDGGDVGGHATQRRHSSQRTLSGATENNYAVRAPGANPDSARLAKRLRRPAGHLDLLELATRPERDETAVRRPEESLCVFRAGQMPGLERLQVANPYARLPPAGSERELASIGRKCHPQAVILVFGQRDLDARRFHGSRRGLCDEDAAPVAPQMPISALGDLWLLGPHRLLCGDATDPQAVRRLLGDVKPMLMVTDPPYGVRYDPEWRKLAGVNNSKRMGKVSNDDRSDWREAWALFPGDVAYVWHGALHAASVAESLEACGFGIRSQIVWAKPSLVMGRGHYHWQHEPCWYAVRGTGHWNGDRKQSTLWDIENRNQDAETIHSTQKPVECMRRPMVNNSKRGQAVYEPFSGSGTTIIACEKESRIALAIELEPAYIDVAALRWQNFTGKQAVLEGDGRTFEEIALERAGAPA